MGCAKHPYHSVQITYAEMRFIAGSQCKAARDLRVLLACLAEWPTEWTAPYQILEHPLRILRAEIARIASGKPLPPKPCIDGGWCEPCGLWHRRGSARREYQRRYYAERRRLRAP